MQLHTIIKSLENAVVAVNEEGRILGLNEVAARWLGRRSGPLPEELSRGLGLAEWEWPGEGGRRVRLGCRSGEGASLELEVEVGAGQLAGERIYLLVMRDLRLWEEWGRSLPEPRSDRWPGKVAGGGGAAVLPAAGDPKRILVVDDEELVRRVVAAVLAHQGYRVTVVASGAEAVEVVRAEPAGFDLVLMDLNMPEIGGWEALRQIREQAPALRAILLSGDLEEVSGAENMSMGGVEFLQKPFDNTGLLRRVEALLQPSER